MSAHKSKNSSTLGCKYTVNKNPRNVFHVTIQEPLERGFQHNPYLGHSDTFSTIGGCPKLGNFQNFDFKTKNVPFG